MRALTTAASGMKAQEINLDVIAHNLANVSTAGFKRRDVNFEDLLYVDVRTPGVTAADGTESPNGYQIGSGAAVTAMTAIHTQGTLEPTGNALDVAIDGEGFFQVQPSGGGALAYTRSGNLKLNSAGNLVSADGFPLTGGITIPPNASNISIGRDGTVTYTAAGDLSQVVEAGQIPLYRFQNPAGLESAGGNLFTETKASGQPIAGLPDNADFGALKSGYLERSNVDVVGELIRMIMAQRAYEINSRSIKAGDEMLSLVARLGRA